MNITAGETIVTVWYWKLIADDSVKAFHVMPPSVVLRIVPCQPATTPTSALHMDILYSIVDTPTDTVAQVTPASGDRIILPASPIAMTV